MPHCICTGTGLADDGINVRLASSSNTRLGLGRGDSHLLLRRAGFPIWGWLTTAALLGFLPSRLANLGTKLTKLLVCLRGHAFEVAQHKKPETLVKFHVPDSKDIGQVAVLLRARNLQTWAPGAPARRERICAASRSLSSPAVVGRVRDTKSLASRRDSAPCT